MALIFVVAVNGIAEKTLPLLRPTRQKTLDLQQQQAKAPVGPQQVCCASLPLTLAFACRSLEAESKVGIQDLELPSSRRSSQAIVVDSERPWMRET